MLSQQHLKKNLQVNQAIGYAAFSAIFFNFGSILIWMLSKTYLPDNRIILLAYGIISGMGLLYTATSYAEILDRYTKATTNPIGLNEKLIQDLNLSV